MKIADLGRPVGHSANLYAWGKTQVVKLYEPELPREHVLAMGKREKALFDAGLPVPEVFELVEIEGRLGQVYERIEGRTFADVLLTVTSAEADCVEQYARLFGEVQATIHAAAADDFDVPNFKAEIPDVLERIEILHPKLRKKVLDHLAQLPDGDRICHGDYHPFNVIQSPRGPVVIDWLYVRKGAPLADFAWTTLLSVGFGRMMSEIKELVERFTEISQQHYFAASGSSREEMEAWWPVVCAMRLADSETELHPWLLDEIRRCL